MGIRSLLKKTDAAGDICVRLCPRGRAFDLRGRHGHAVSFLQNVVLRHGLAVDPDQKVRGFSAGHLDPEKLVDIRVLGNVEIIGKAAVKLSVNVAVHTRLQNRT